MKQTAMVILADNGLDLHPVRHLSVRGRALLAGYV